MQKIKAYNDYFVKFLFTAKNNEPHTLSFINAVLSDSGGPLIRSIKIENPFNLKESFDAKETIVDVSCTTENGEIFLIEIQVLRQRDYQNRAVYYWAKNFSKQLKSGQEYHILRPVIAIHVLNYTQFASHKDIHSIFKLRDREHDSTLTEHMALHFIEMPKTKSIKAATKLLRWLKYFRNADMGEDSIKDILTEDEEIAAAYETYKKFVSNPKLVDAAIKRDIFLSDQASREHYAKVEGRKEGMVEGSESRLEHQVKIKLRKGKKLEQIIDETESTLEEIQKIIKKIDSEKSTS